MSTHRGGLAWENERPIRARRGGRGWDCAYVGGEARSGPGRMGGSGSEPYGVGMIPKKIRVVLRVTRKRVRATKRNVARKNGK